MAQLSNRDIIIRLLKSDLSDYDNLLSLLGMANEVLSEDKELSKKLANKVRFLALRLCSTGDIKYYNLYNQALLFLAQKHKDFDSYLLYVEKTETRRTDTISREEIRFTGLYRRCNGSLMMSWIFCQYQCHPEPARPLWESSSYHL